MSEGQKVDGGGFAFPSDSVNKQYPASRTEYEDGIVIETEEIRIQGKIVDEHHPEEGDEVPENISDEEWERFQESQRREFRMGKAEHDRERSKDGE